MSEAVSVDQQPILTALGQETLRGLLRVWFEFERRLSGVEIIGRLQRGTFTMEDYRTLLLNLRPQVIEGSRWITRCASSFDANFADIRSTVIGHAFDEHRDYEMIEHDFAAAGGDVNCLLQQTKNPGSEALHGYLMYRASLPNPTDMLGAMWIIEGLGNKMANEWAGRIEELTGNRQHTKFLRYHADNDDAHLQKLYRLLDRLCQTEHDGKAIIMAATVVSRLYVLQLDEIEHACV